MSVSMHGKAVLGFRVTRDDFIKTIPVKATCEKGHPQKDSGPFCSQDGTAFEARNNERPRDTLKALYEFKGIRWDEDDTAEEAYHDLREGEGPLFGIQVAWNESFSVAGVQLVELNSYRKWSGSIDDELLRQSRIVVEAMRETLGMTDRPIEIFFAANMS